MPVQLSCVLKLARSVGQNQGLPCRGESLLRLVGVPVGLDEQTQEVRLNQYRAHSA